MLSALWRLVRVYRTNFILYFGVGGVSALLEWSVFWVGITFTPHHYLIAAFAGFLLATGLNYILSVRFVFRSGRHTPGYELWLTYLVSALGAAGNFAILALLHEGFDTPLLPAKIAATGCAFLWNFIARQFLVFHQDPEGVRGMKHTQPKSTPSTIPTLES
ncbi:MAG: GtrA family protein [Magnetococcales bacterium]|nr:GtrA family protein [Magnetococcales bacterium]